MYLTLNVAFLLIISWLYKYNQQCSSCYFQDIYPPPGNPPAFKCLLYRCVNGKWKSFEWILNSYRQWMKAFMPSKMPSLEILQDSSTTACFIVAVLYNKNRTISHQRQLVTSLFFVFFPFSPPPHCLCQVSSSQRRRSEKCVGHFGSARAEGTQECCSLKVEGDWAFCSLCARHQTGLTSSP